MSAFFVYIFIPLIIAILIYKLAKPVKLIATARMAGIQVTLLDIIGMFLRGVPVDLILNSSILAKKEGIDISLTTLEAHYLADGNLKSVVFGLVTAKQANLEFTFEEAAAIDLAGYSVLDEVQLALETRIITTPLIEVISKDGRKVRISLNITLKTILQKVIGGISEESIIARAGVYINNLASSTNHTELLSSQYIVNKMMEFHLDKNTRFEIISFEIAEIY